MRWAGNLLTLFGALPPGEGGACRLEIEQDAPLDLALVNGNGTWVRLLSLPAEEIPDELAVPLPGGAVRVTWVRWDPSGALRRVELLRQPDPLVTARCVADGATGFEVPFLRAGIYHISVDGVPAGTAAVPEGGATRLELRGGSAGDHREDASSRSGGEQGAGADQPWSARHRRRGRRRPVRGGRRPGRPVRGHLLES